MAKVNVNEFVIQLEHDSDKVDSDDPITKSEDEEEESEKSSESLDVDTLVDLCVERVFQLLKNQKNR